LVLNEGADFEAVWGDGTLGLTASCTSDDGARHGWDMLEDVGKLDGEVVGKIGVLYIFEGWGLRSDERSS
jgi:hypothetical protein